MEQCRKDDAGTTKRGHTILFCFKSSFDMKKHTHTQSFVLWSHVSCILLFKDLSYPCSYHVVFVFSIRVYSLGCSDFRKKWNFLEAAWKPFWGSKLRALHIIKEINNDKIGDGRRSWFIINWNRLYFIKILTVLCQDHHYHW